MSFSTSTLDANSETHVFSVSPGQQAELSLTISGTITVTLTRVIPGGSNAVTVLDNGSAAAYTASRTLTIESPGTYTLTASGVSGGSCVAASFVYGALS